MVEKAVSTVTIVLESRPTRSLVGKLPQRSSIAVREFRAASEERCEQGNGRVFAKLNSTHRGTSERPQLCKGASPNHFGTETSL